MLEKKRKIWLAILAIVLCIFFQFSLSTKGYFLQWCIIFICSVYTNFVIIQSCLNTWLLTCTMVIQNTVSAECVRLDCIVQCFTSPPTQYRLYGRRFLQVKRPNQQYQSTEGSYKGKQPKEHKENRKYTHTQNSIQITVTQTNTASPLVYNNMGWLGDSSHRGQVR